MESALEEYDMQMDAMEERLAKLWRDKLMACQDAEDMFQVFARFNPLLSRTRVRVAVKEFQVQLIATFVLKNMKRRVLPKFPNCVVFHLFPAKFCGPNKVSPAFQ
jgi:hypothetical protein